MFQNVTCGETWMEGVKGYLPISLQVFHVIMSLFPNKNILIWVENVFWQNPRRPICVAYLSKENFDKEYTALQKRRLRGKNYMTVRLTWKVKFIGLVLRDINVVMPCDLPLFNYSCKFNAFMVGDPTKCASLKVYWELSDYNIMKWRTLVWSPLISHNKTRILLSLPRTTGTRHRIKYLTYFKQSLWSNLKIYGTQNSRKEATWGKVKQEEG